MRSFRRARWWLTGAIFLLPAVTRAGNGPPSVDFNRQIRPILSESCYQCHGPDVNKRKADLRLDQRDGLFQSAGRHDDRRAREARRERTARSDHGRRPRAPHAAAQERSAPLTRPGRPDQALDRRGSRVERALGLSSPERPAVPTAPGQPALDERNRPVHPRPARRISGSSRPPRPTDGPWSAGSAST